jgi:hypothetical protein
LGAGPLGMAKTGFQPWRATEDQKGLAVDPVDGRLKSTSASTRRGRRPEVRSISTAGEKPRASFPSSTLRAKARTILGIAAAGAVLGIGVAPAVARAPSHPTDVTINIAVLGRGVFAEGQVLSPARACMSGRKVLIIEITEAGNEVVDVDHASDHGFYGGSGKVPGARPTGLKVKAPRTVVGRPGHRQVCRRDAFAVHIPPG